VHRQHATTRQAEELRLAAAFDGVHAIAHEQPGASSGKRTALRAVQQADTRYGPAHGNRARDAGGEFDFRKLGHVSTRALVVESSA
jgi:hypothetical protein